MHVQGTPRRNLPPGPDNRDMRRTAPRAVAVPSPQRARPHRIAALAVLAASTALLAAVGSAHADIAPTLSAELATAVPGKDLTVIVSLAAQVDPAAYANDPTGLVAAEHAL